MEEYMNQVSDDEEDSETIYDSNSSIYSDSDEIEYVSQHLRMMNTFLRKTKMKIIIKTERENFLKKHEA